jgi:hypothetical protein
MIRNKVVAAEQARDRLGIEAYWPYLLAQIDGEEVAG